MHLAYYDSVAAGPVKVSITNVNLTLMRIDAIVTDKSNNVWDNGDKLIEVPAHRIVSRERVYTRNGIYRIRPSCGMLRKNTLDDKYCVRTIGHVGDCESWEVK